MERPADKWTSIRVYLSHKDEYTGKMAVLSITQPFFSLRKEKYRLNDKAIFFCPVCAESNSNSKV